MFIVAELVSLTKVDCRLLIWKPFQRSDDLLNETPTSSPSPLAEMTISWAVQQYSTVIFTESTISCYTT